MNSKPIDWLKPLRPPGLVDHVMHVVHIDPNAEFGIKVRNLVTGEERLVNRIGFADHGDYPIVENVPPKPTLVERFAVVHRDGHPGDYTLAATVMTTRKKADDLAASCPMCRVAILLIEEPGE